MLSLIVLRAISGINNVDFFRRRSLTMGYSKAAVVFIGGKLIRNGDKYIFIDLQD